MQNIDALRLRVYGYLTAGWHGELIQAELDANNNSPAKALENVSDWANNHLGQHGFAGGQIRVQVYGTVKSGKGAQVWYGEDHWDRPPDELITWLQIFTYVADGYQQLQLL